MEKYSILVDAGYFWAQARTMMPTTLEKKLPIVDQILMRQSLLRLGQKLLPERELFRIYWYDGYIEKDLHGKGYRTDFNEKIAELNNFKLRLGTVNSVGQQKGVDGLIIADLITLAQNHIVSDVLLISGDADLAPGVFTAQMLGIRVHQVELGPKEATSPVLRREVDCSFFWPENDVQQFISSKFVAKDFAMQPKLSKYSGAGSNEKVLNSQEIKELKAALSSLSSHFSKSEIQELESISDPKQIPPELDIKALQYLSDAIKGGLSKTQTFYYRAFLFSRFNFEEVDKLYERTLSEEQISTLFDSLTSKERNSILQQGYGIPPEIDKKLLSQATQLLKRPLLTQEANELRGIIKTKISSSIQAD